MNEERFANELDRIASGQPPEEADALAAFARDVQMHQGAARLDPDRRAGIRRNLMQHATTLSTGKSATGGTGPLSQPALTDPATYNPWVRRPPAVNRTPSGWRGHIVKAQTAIAIMTVFALLIVGSAWYTNQQGGGGSLPPNTTRYAAAPTEAAVMTGGDDTSSVNIGQDGPAPGSPSPGVSDDAWWSYIDPEECDPASVQPATVTGTTADTAGPTYLPLSAPDPADAEAATRTARALLACVMVEADQETLEQFLTDPARLRVGMPTTSEFFNNALVNGRVVSEAYPEQDPRAFVRLTGQEPDWDAELETGRMGGYSSVFIPDHAVQLADGRIAIPDSQVAWEGTNNFFPYGHPDDLTFYNGTLFVLNDASGEWRVDDLLSFCVGDCDSYWAEQEATAQQVAAQGTGTPPMVQGEGWTEPITADQCIPREPRTSSERHEIASGTPAFPERAYGPDTVPSVRDAADVAMTLRRYQACLMADTNADGYVSERFIHESSALAPDAPAWTDEAKIRAGQEVSGLYQDVGPAEFVILTDEPEGTPPTSMRIVESPGVYEPRHARQMADGRIALPATQLDPGGMFPQNRSTHIGNVYLLSESDSGWVVDEMLPFCVGDCNDLWAAMAQSANQPATPVSAAPTEESTPLLDLLSVLPAPLAIAEDGVLPGWAYADIDQRFEDLGLTDEALADDPALPLASNAYGPLAHTTPLFDYAADEEFVAAIGFNPLEVDQVLVTGRAPDVLTLLRGNWDEETLTAAWEAAGYTEIVTETGHTIWSLDPDGWVDPQHPIQRRMFQQMNNVAILDGGILAYAGYSTTIEMVIQTQSGEMASAIDDSWLQPLFSAVSDETISGIGFTQPGSTLYDLGEIAANPNLTPDDLTAIEDQLRASREAVGPMPEYRGAIFTVEGDPTGEGAIIVQMRAFSGEDAEQVARVVEWRWENLTSQRYQRTFDSIMPLVGATVDGDIVTLRFDPQGDPGMWLELLQGGDLLVFAVDAGLPTGTPEAAATPQAIAEEDASWWSRPENEECRLDEFSRTETGDVDWPEREYLPLDTPDRQDAEAASRVPRAARSCGAPYVAEPLLTERAYNERILEEDLSIIYANQAEEIRNGRAISQAYPIQDPQAFGRLTNETADPATPAAQANPYQMGNPYAPYSAVIIRLTLSCSRTVGSPSRKASSRWKATRACRPAARRKRGKCTPPASSSSRTPAASGWSTKSCRSASAIVTPSGASKKPWQTASTRWPPRKPLTTQTRPRPNSRGVRSTDTDGRQARWLAAHSLPTRDVQSALVAGSEARHAGESFTTAP